MLHLLFYLLKLTFTHYEIMSFISTVAAEVMVFTTETPQKKKFPAAPSSAATISLLVHRIQQSNAKDFISNITIYSRQEIKQREDTAS